MNGFLLDTSVALVALRSLEQLSPTLGEPRLGWSDAVENLAARILPVRPEHVAALSGLPPIHKDPLDRMLIAQAIVKGLVLVASHREIPKYAAARARLCVSRSRKNYFFNANAT